MPTALQDTMIQDDFSSGMVRDVAPHLIPPDGAYDIVNGLLNQDGSIYRRGGSTYKTTSAFGSTGLRFIWDGYMEPGQRTVVANVSDFGVINSTDDGVVNLGSSGLTRPYSYAYLEGLLFIGDTTGGHIYGGSRKTANYTTGTIAVTNGSKTVTGTGTSWTANADPGMLLQRGNERVYVVDSVDSNTQITLRDAYEGTTGSGISYTLSPIYDITAADPYPSSELFAVSQNRLLWAKGKNLLGFTEIQKPHDQTNQFNTTNQHDVPEGLRLLGIAAVGPHTMLFTTNGAWTLQGMALDIVDAIGTPLHRLLPLSRDLILWGHSGIATWEQTLIVPCTQGIYLVDGTSRPVLISQNISPLIEFYVKSPYHLGQAAVYKNHYLLPILDSGGRTVDILVCRLSRMALDRRRRQGFSWSRLDGTGAKQSGFAIRVGDITASRGNVLLGSGSKDTSRVENCSGWFDPDASTKNDPDGTSHALDVTTKDYMTGNNTLNVVRKARWRYELSATGSDLPILIFAIGSGAKVEGANWDEVTWDNFTWGAGGSAFTNLTPTGGVDNGEHPVTTRIRAAGRKRFVRFRITSNGPTPACVIRSLEVTVRPSEALRR